MWLPMQYSYHRNFTVANISQGKYANIRLMAGDSQHSRSWPWKTAAQSIADGNASSPDYSLFQFSAACWYFAEVLTNILGSEAPPLGLISTAIGGSMVEQWIPNSTVASCKNLSLASHNQGLWDDNVRPYLKMTVKGWLWYQGENDMHGVKGNYLDKTGYACAMPALVQKWREEWSAEPGTTDANAPFGLVAIPSSGSEGGQNIGAMNWAQTASYGSLPNKAMPNSFIAEAFDLNDPWGDKTCYGWQCCAFAGNWNKTTCAANTQKQRLPTNVCVNYCEALQGTPVYMGGIHPRSKYPVGQRLAISASGQVYGAKTPASGPVLSGCSVTGGAVTVKFDAKLLRGDQVVVQPYNHSGPNTGAAVLANISLFCVEPLLRCQINATTGVRPDTCGSKYQEWWCPKEASAGVSVGAGRLPATADDVRVHAKLWASYAAERLGGVPPRNPFEGAWTVAPVGAGPSGSEIVIDGGAVNVTTVVAVRYAWHQDCCKNEWDKTIGKTHGCALENCPVMSSPTNLPPNPFMAFVKGGKCSCMKPQVCDE